MQSLFVGDDLRSLIPAPIKLEPPDVVSYRLGKPFTTWPFRGILSQRIKTAFGRRTHWHYEKAAFDLFAECLAAPGAVAIV
jgi:hypothetical protein